MKTFVLLSGTLLLFSYSFAATADTPPCPQDQAADTSISKLDHDVSNAVVVYGSTTGSIFGVHSAQNSDDPSLSQIENAVLSCKNYDDFDEAIVLKVSGANPDKLLHFLQDVAKNPSVDVRKAALDVAAKTGKPALSILETAAQSRELRSRVAILAMDMGKDAVPLEARIYPSLNADDRFYIASNAVSSFGASSLPILNLAMHDKSDDPKKGALSSATSLGALALPLYQAGIQGSCDVKSFAVELAPAVLGSGALQTLERDGRMSDCDQVRESMMVAAAQIADPTESVKILLIGVADPKPHVRLAATELAGALGPKIGWDKVMAVLRIGIKDQSPDQEQSRRIRLQAAHAVDFAGPGAQEICDAAKNDLDPEIAAVGRGGCHTAPPQAAR